MWGFRSDLTRKTCCADTPPPPTLAAAARPRLSNPLDRVPRGASPLGPGRAAAVAGSPAAARCRSALPAQYSVHRWSGSSASTASEICNRQVADRHKEAGRAADKRGYSGWHAGKDREAGSHVSRKAHKKEIKWAGMEAGKKQEDWQAVAARASTCCLALTLGWLSPKYSGPAIAVLGGGGRPSPALRRASISALMRFRIFSPRDAGSRRVRRQQ